MSLARAWIDSAVEDAKREGGSTEVGVKVLISIAFSLVDLVEETKRQTEHAKAMLDAGLEAAAEAKSALVQIRLDSQKAPRRRPDIG